jgi:hypothetical protein
MANVRPDQAPTKAAAATDAIYTQENGTLRKVPLSSAKLFLAPDLVEPGGVFTLPATGNTAYASKIVRSDDERTWYVDGAGNAVLIFDPEYITTAFEPGGDLAGPIDDVTVVAIRGRGVLSTAPTTGQVLKWNGTAWAPANEALLNASALPSYTDNAAAIAGGLSAGQLYVVAAGSDTDTQGTLKRVY